MSSEYVEALNINGEVVETAIGTWRVKVKEPARELDNERLTYEIIFLPEQSDIPKRILKLRTYGEIILAQNRGAEIGRKVLGWLEFEEGDGEISIYS
jgi:uncharacterized protein YicC (UPF0701 family)